MSKAEIVENAEVSNTINMNLSQNDLIDLVIQEKLEENEIAMKAVDEIIEKCKQAENDITKKHCDIHVKAFEKKDKSLQDFYKITKQFGIKPDVKSSLYHSEVYNEDVNLIGEYQHYNLEVDYKNIASYKRNMYVNQMRKVKVEDIHIEACSEKGSIMLIFKDDITLSSAVRKKIEDEIYAVRKEKLVALKEKARLSLEWLEYTYGEKKIKSKIIRASLQRSAQGQEILGMLGKVSNVKLLS